MTAGVELSRAASEWAPGFVTTADVLDPRGAADLATVIQAPAAPSDGEPLPDLWHGAYFDRWLPRAALGEDGHPAISELLPPIGNRRRMFAGGVLTTRQPLIVGHPATRHSKVTDVMFREGRRAPLLFVNVTHEISQDGAVKVVDEQRLVYSTTNLAARTGTTPATTAPISESAKATPHDRSDRAESDGDVTFTTTDLFRFSAVTHNTHRIHYDEHYATSVEGHAGLVVHGPLLATVARQRFPMDGASCGWTFTYRLHAPTFANERCHLRLTADPDTAENIVEVIGPDEMCRCEMRATPPTSGGEPRA